MQPVPHANDKKQIQQVIVVEGKNDTAAVRRAVLADTIETGGSAINAAILERIKLAAERRGVIVLTDPDHAGERIRSIIVAHVPQCAHAFIAREQATSARDEDIGVENATPDVIRYALEHARSAMMPPDRPLPAAADIVTMADMLQHLLIGDERASARRNVVGRELGIGYANGKTFLKRCTMFHITKQELASALQRIESKGE